LLPHAQQVKVAHPLMLRAIAAAKKKNDRIDVGKIADCLRRDLRSVVVSLVTSQSTYYEPLWEQLSARQRAVLQAIAYRGASEIYPQGVREEFLGPASSVQKALQSLDSRDILFRYKGNYFFLDPLFPCWIRKKEGGLRAATLLSVMKLSSHSP
jgi:hypothetical protein